MHDDLRGYVSAATRTRIHGWALSTKDYLYRPEIEVVQGGQVVLTAMPSITDYTIPQALGLPPATDKALFRWSIMMPTSSGLVVDEPFTVRFRETKVPLSRGMNLIIPLIAKISAAAKEDLEQTIFLTFGEKIIDRTLNISMTTHAFDIDRFDCHPTCNDKLINQVECTARAGEPGVMFGFPSKRFAWSIPLSQLFGANEFAMRIGINCKDLSERHKFHRSLRQLYIPKTIADSSLRIAPVPDLENIKRVAGPSTQHTFMTGGLTAFMQINCISERFLGRSITELPLVVDWGCGCARVMRHFFESAPRLGLKMAPQSVVGLDMDRYNIEWSQNNLGKGSFEQTDPNRGLPFESKSVNLLYGISVMTHLSEYEQRKYLQEIKRILRPDGIAILSFNGEPKYYRLHEGLHVSAVEHFGISDNTPDETLGREMSAYYRATYNSRSYISDIWGSELTVDDVIPAAQAFSQDYVVLRSREATN